jgi:hypothetical protein
VRVGMIQPNYLPWRGYFDFIASVDLFVFYDDVPLGTGRKWRNRNRIRTHRGPRWLTVPVRGGQSDVLLHAVEIAVAENWQRRHVDLLRTAYAQTAYPHIFERFAEVLVRPWKLLADLDIALTCWLMSELRITTPTCRSSELEIGAEDKWVRPLRVLEHLGATAYLIGPTAMDYTDVDAFTRKGIRLEVKSYDYPSYPQLWPGFEPQVSVLDLLLTHGGVARSHMTSQSPNRILSG